MLKHKEIINENTTLFIYDKKNKLDFYNQFDKVKVSGQFYSVIQIDFSEGVEKIRKENKINLPEIRPDENFFILITK